MPPQGRHGAPECLSGSPAGPVTLYACVCMTCYVPVMAADKGLYSGARVSKGSMLLATLGCRLGCVAGQTALVPGTETGRLGMTALPPAASGRQEVSRLSPRVCPRLDQPLPGRVSACSKKKSVKTAHTTHITLHCNIGLGLLYIASDFAEGALSHQSVILVRHRNMQMWASFSTGKDTVRACL